MVDLLLLFLASSAVLVQGREKSNDPNDEPFLPIYPVYPYSPKLIKRGTAEKESTAQLSQELYAPKVDAKDSYSASYSTNHPRDPHYPNQNPQQKVSSPPTYAYYTTIPYTSPTTPYNPYASYTVSPPSYTAIPYSSSYPGYYYQPPYYYPDYYNQPLFPPPPSPPPVSDYSIDSYSDSDISGKSPGKKSSGDKKQKENGVNQFVDGANYISESSKDLDGQSSTHNQLEQTSGLRGKNLPFPLSKTTYKAISVPGQPADLDYHLPVSYAKAQQLEELMNRAWAKLLAQNLQQVSQYPEVETDKSSATRTNDGQYANQNDQSKDTRLVSVPSTIAKTDLTYIVNPGLLGKLSVAQTTGQAIQPPTTQLKSIKYPFLNSGMYTTIEKPGKDQDQSNEYENYDSSSSKSSQEYDGSLNQADKQQQNYENDSGQTHQNQNHVTAQTPRGYDYRYSSYDPSQATTQRESQRYQNNLDDASFGAKTKNG